MTGKFWPADGRVVIFACDHARRMGVIPGLATRVQRVEMVRELADFYDYVMSTPGELAYWTGEGAIRRKVIVSIDGFGGAETSQELQEDLLCSLDDLVQARERGLFRVDGVKIMPRFGRGLDVSLYEQVRTNFISWRCFHLKMPLVVEPFYVMRVTRRGMRISKKPEDVMWIARRLDAQCPWITAFKLPLTKNFSQIVESLNSPVISLGGPKRVRVRDFLADTVSALKQGAAGVAYGRNVFQDRKPRALMHAVWAIVHEGANLGQAVQIYKVSE